METVSRKEQLESTTTKKDGDMEDAMEIGAGVVQVEQDDSQLFLSMNVQEIDKIRIISSSGGPDQAEQSEHKKRYYASWTDSTRNCTVHWPG